MYWCRSCSATFDAAVHAHAHYQDTGHCVSYGNSTAVIWASVPALLRAAVAWDAGMRASQHLGIDRGAERARLTELRDTFTDLLTHVDPVEFAAYLVSTKPK